MLSDHFRAAVEEGNIDEFADLFTAIPSETFRADVSSTELRRVHQAFEPDTGANVEREKS